jgi:hypothetical protein
LVFAVLAILLAEVARTSISRDFQRPRRRSVVFYRSPPPEKCSLADPISARLDFDGDGRNDRLTIFEEGPSFAVHCSWEEKMRLDLATGRVIEELAPFGDPLRPLGTTDLNRDGKPEVWLELGGGSAQLVGAITLGDSGRIVEVGWFTYSAGWRADAGVECTDIDGDGSQEIVETLLGREDLSPDSYAGELDGSWFYRMHRVDGGAAEVIREERGDDPSDRPGNLSWARGFSCDVDDAG